MLCSCTLFSSPVSFGGVIIELGVRRRGFPAARAQGDDFNVPANVEPVRRQRFKAPRFIILSCCFLYYHCHDGTPSWFCAFMSSAGEPPLPQECAVVWPRAVRKGVRGRGRGRTLFATNTIDRRDSRGLCPPLPTAARSVATSTTTGIPLTAAAMARDTMSLQDLFSRARRPTAKPSNICNEFLTTKGLQLISLLFNHLIHCLCCILYLYVFVVAPALASFLLDSRW